MTTTTMLHQSEGRLRKEFHLLPFGRSFRRMRPQRALGGCRPARIAKPSLFRFCRHRRPIVPQRPSPLCSTIIVSFDCARVARRSNAVRADRNRPRQPDACPPQHALSPELAGMKQYAMRSFPGCSCDGFDMSLIDCPPNLYLCSWNAMLAADFVVIPVPPEDFGTQGLRVVHQAMEQRQAAQSAACNLLGHVVTRCDSRLLGSSSLREETAVALRRFRVRNRDSGSFSVQSRSGLPPASHLLQPAVQSRPNDAFTRERDPRTKQRSNDEDEKWPNDGHTTNACGYRRRILTNRWAFRRHRTPNRP